MRALCVLHTRYRGTPPQFSGYIILAEDLDEMSAEMQELKKEILAS